MCTCKYFCLQKCLVGNYGIKRRYFCKENNAVRRKDMKFNRIGIRCKEISIKCRYCCTFGIIFYCRMKDKLNYFRILSIRLCYIGCMCYFWGLQMFYKDNLLILRIFLSLNSNNSLFYIISNYFSQAIHILNILIKNIQ